MSLPSMPSDGWMRFEYRTIHITSGSRRPTIAARVPALTIRAREAGAHAQMGHGPAIKSQGVLDTGAITSTMPLWATNELRMRLGGGSKRRMASASGWFDAYQTAVELDISHGGKWLDVGTVHRVVPDTEMSRDPAQHQPFLLGRGDFLEKFQMVVNEAKGVVWLHKCNGGDRRRQV